MDDEQIDQIGKQIEWLRIINESKLQNKKVLRHQTIPFSIHHFMK